MLCYTFASVLALRTTKKRAPFRTCSKVNLGCLQEPRNSQEEDFHVTFPGWSDWPTIQKMQAEREHLDTPHICC